MKITNSITPGFIPTANMVKGRVYTPAPGNVGRGHYYLATQEPGQVVNLDSGFLIKGPSTDEWVEVNAEVIIK